MGRGRDRVRATRAPPLPRAGRERSARESGASLERAREYPEFRRLLARRGDETCLVDLVIDRALDDARRKDAAVDPATLAWVPGEISIGAQAALPGGVDPSRISAFRDAYVLKLRAKAMATARGTGGGDAAG